MATVLRNRNTHQLLSSRSTLLISLTRRSFYGNNNGTPDPILGKSIHNRLFDLGIETPIMKSRLEKINNEKNDEHLRNQKIEKISEHFRSIMEILNLDLTDDSLKDTPKRVAKMYVNEIFTGLDIDNFPKATVVDNKMSYNEMVISCNINVQSVCEHHFVPFSGVCHVAYFPDKKVLGLSKLNRIVRYFCRRPQIQERLTEQIFSAISQVTQTENVAVVIEAQHFCVKFRGIEDQHSYTRTHRLGGSLIDDARTREEFFRSIPNRNNRN